MRAGEEPSHAEHKDASRGRFIPFGRESRGDLARISAAWVCDRYLLQTFARHGMYARSVAGGCGPGITRHRGESCPRDLQPARITSKGSKREGVSDVAMAKRRGT